jgi:hypothetical protein
MLDDPECSAPAAEAALAIKRSAVRPRLIGPVPTRSSGMSGSNGLLAPTQFLDPSRPAGGRLFADARLLHADDARVFPPMIPRNLGELVARLEADETILNEDALVPMSTLKMTVAGTIRVPDRGDYRLTSWTKKQLAQRLGIRWDTWFSGIDPQMRADEINRRLVSRTGIVRVRTDCTLDPFDGGDGALRGMVSSTYSPIPDVGLARVLQGVLPDAAATPVHRYAETDRTLSYVVQIGDEFRIGGPANVGDVYGGLLVRNSGVGFASLLVAVHLTRLVCKNGMVAPENARVLKRVHRRTDVGAIKNELLEQLSDLPDRIHRAGRVLERSAHHPIGDVRQALKDVLAAAAVPMRMLPIMLAAYDRAPHRSVFGVTQAITLGAQDSDVEPEDRISLERAAGQLLGQYAGDP